MSWTHVIIVSCLLQALFITSIDGNAIRRRRQQTSPLLYGNQNQAGNVPAGVNYPSNANLYGTNLNNQGAKDLYGNPVVPSNTANTMNNMGLTNQQQQQQQQQFYGANSQSLANPGYGNTGLYSGSGTNQLSRDTNVNMGMRDNNGNLLPAGSVGSSLYSSSNSQMGYPPNTNQVLSNKEMYNLPANTNNNQYGLNSNSYPNTNTYGGQMGTRNNNNNNNNNAWPNNQHNTNAGEAWNQNRDSSNTNTNNNAYANPNSPYFYNNAGHQLMTSCLILLSSFIAISFFHI